MSRKGAQFGAVATVLALWLVCVLGAAGQAPAPAQMPGQTPPQTHGRAASQGVVNAAPPSIVGNDGAIAPTAGVLVDQVVAIVNGELVLESDLDEEQRFEAFQPVAQARTSRDDTVERMIDRTLILQQAKLQPENVVTPDQAEAQLNSLRKEIPACKAYDCATDAGWAKFIAAQGFTRQELIARWQQRMEVLKFIEERFRMGIQITPAQIKEYDTKTLLPEYARRNAKAPPLDVISDRIQEILLQQQVSALLGDWLKTLKAEGTVRVMRPGGVQP